MEKSPYRHLCKEGSGFRTRGFLQVSAITFVDCFLVLLVFGSLKLICRGVKGFRSREAFSGKAERAYLRPRRGWVTIIVSVKFNDGIVVASDNTTAFFRESEFVRSYDNANKIFNLYKGLPIGAATCGTGGIGNASISTLSKDLRERFQGSPRGCTDWKVDPEKLHHGGYRATGPRVSADGSRG